MILFKKKENKPTTVERISNDISELISKVDIYSNQIQGLISKMDNKEKDLI